jgi:hypothetical protein
VFEGKTREEKRLETGPGGAERQFEWMEVRIKMFAGWNREAVAVFNCPGTFSFPVFNTRAARYAKIMFFFFFFCAML